VPDGEPPERARFDTAEAEAEQALQLAELVYVARTISVR